MKVFQYIAVIMEIYITSPEIPSCSNIEHELSDSNTGMQTIHQEPTILIPFGFRGPFIKFWMAWISNYIRYSREKLLSILKHQRCSRWYVEWLSGFIWHSLGMWLVHAGMKVILCWGKGPWGEWNGCATFCFPCLAPFQIISGYKTALWNYSAYATDDLVACWKWRPDAVNGVGTEYNRSCNFISMVCCTMRHGSNTCTPVIR